MLQGNNELGNGTDRIALLRAAVDSMDKNAASMTQACKYMIFDP